MWSIVVPDARVTFETTSTKHSKQVVTEIILRRVSEPEVVEPQRTGRKCQHSLRGRCIARNAIHHLFINVKPVVSLLAGMYEKLIKRNLTSHVAVAHKVCGDNKAEL